MTTTSRKPNNYQNFENENDSLDEDEDTISVLENDDNLNDFDDSSSAITEAIDTNNQSVSSKRGAFTKSFSSISSKLTPSHEKTKKLQKASTTFDSLPSGSSQVSSSSSFMAHSSRKEDVSEYMESFLELVRNGSYTKIHELIQTSNMSNDNESPSSKTSSPKSNKKLDLNYRGKTKRFYGWTSLHISCYFNHTDIVKLLLQVRKMNDY